MHSIFTAYLDLLDEAKRDPSTVANNRLSFVKFDEWADHEGLDPATLTTVELRRFVNELLKQYKVSTVERHFVHVRSAYAYAYECGLVSVNPTAGIAKLMPNVPDVAPRILTAAEQRLVYAAAPSDRERLMHKLFALTGMRRFELAALSWDTEGNFVDFANSQFVIIGKGGKHRFVPMHPALMKPLSSAAAVSGSSWVFHSNYSGGAVTGKLVWRAFREMFDAAGLNDVSKPTHSFRATLNTNLGRQGVRPDVLDSIFGWAATTVRSRYYTGTAHADARDAILKAYTDDPVWPEMIEAKPTVTDDLALKIRLLELENENLRLRAAVA